MAYQKQTWVDYPDLSSPITSERLNHMEDGIADAWEHGGGGAGDTLRIGSIIPFSGDTAPNGYMICDGTAISRTEYAELFSVIGTTFGSGDGSTTFNIPNLKGKVPVGLDSNDTDFDTLGETGGEKKHQLTVDEMPKHNHGYTKNQGLWQGGTTGGAEAWAGSTSATTGNRGGDQAHNNLQPYVVLNYIIKATEAQTGEVLSETLPVGSEIDFDGEEVPSGWEQVDGSNLVAYTLYDNTSGALGTITLSDSAANYDYIEIFFRNNLNFYNSTKIYNPDGKLAILSLLYPESPSSQIWIQGAVKSINATSISNVTNRVGEAEVYSKAGYGATDRIYITKVVGYKEG